MVPQGPVDGLYKVGSRTLALDTAPFVHASTPAVVRVFEELGSWTQLRREFTRVEGMTHWAIGDSRLDLDGASARELHECQREWPRTPVDLALAGRVAPAAQSSDLLEAAFGSDAALAPDGFWARRFLARVAGQMPSESLDELAPLAPDHPLRCTTVALQPWLADLSPAQLGKAAQLRLVNLWNAGAEDRVGGRAGLRQHLIQRIEQRSGEVKAGLRVAEILQKRGRVAGVTLLGKRDRYGAEHIVIATDPARLLDGPLEAESLSRPLAVTLAGLRPVAYRYVLHLEVAEQGIGPGFAGTVICVPEGVDAQTLRLQHGIGTIYVRPVEARVAERREDGVRSISITAMISPFAERETLRERVLEELDRRGILPFAAQHTRFVHSPHDGRPATDGAGQPLREPGLPLSVPLPMDAIWSSVGPSSLGVGLLPHSSDIRNLAFAGRLSLPGLGLEGEFVAGHVAAGAIVGASRGGLARSLLIGRS